MRARAFCGFLAMLLAACSAQEGDRPEQVGAPPVVIELGRAGPEAGLATIAVDGQGRALAVAGHEDGSEEAVLVRCLDSSCSDVSRSEVPGNTGIVAFSADGLPLLLLNDRLIRCDDLSCSSFTAGEIPGGPLAMAVAPDGNPIIAVAEDAAGSLLQFSILLCQDPMCATRERAVLERGVLGYDYPAQLELLPGGEPVLFYRDIDGERALVCHDPECSSVDKRDLEQTHPASGEPIDLDLPVRSLITAAPEVQLWLVGCADDRCGELVRTEVGSVLGGLFRDDVVDATGFVATGGVPVVVAAGTIDSRFEAVLIACDDPACSAFSVSRLGATSGVQVAAASRSGGPLAITLNRSGAMWLIVCDNPLVSCVHR